LTLRGWHSPPSGKPLLHFLHGNGFCSRVYEPMLRMLAADFDLWLSDVQGHGDSDPGERFLGWNRNAVLAAEAFAAGRDRFGAAPAYAAGHSFGGVLTSLILAEQPALFQRAALLDPVLFTRTMIAAMTFTDFFRLPSLNSASGQALKRRQHWPDRQAAVDNFRGRGAFKGWTEEALRAYVDHALKDVDAGVTLKCTVTHEATIFASHPERLWATLPKVMTPTLILHGEQTYFFVPKSARRLSRLNVNVREQQVAGGHCFMQEQPQDAAARVREFLLA
jgi:pimeloyl-ACP methyl ester carboxylesterase